MLRKAHELFNMNHLKFFLLNSFLLVLIACADSGQKQVPDKVIKPITTWTTVVQELSNEEYSDNPDIGRMHSELTTLHFDSLVVEKSDGFTYQFQFYNDTIASIVFSDFSIKEFIPQLQERFKSDEYLSKIAIINQEWNRHQVKFYKDRFKVNGTDLNRITRIDIARNCLNSYLWEIIAYADEQGKEKACYHGWFNFPKELYANLFEEVNTIPFAKYESSLVNWVDPESQKINVENLRAIIAEESAEFKSLNDQAYLKTGERDKKFQNIVYPKNTTVVDDFLTDSTLFATFSPPGFYDTKSPRVTHLSKLKRLDSVIQRTVNVSPLKLDSLLELELVFNQGDSLAETHLILSGLNVNDFPVLDDASVHQGWQSSMGFANHTFYETYDHMQNHPVETNPYFAYLADSKGNWIDSHWLGIDGPLFFKDKNGDLNLMLLSFERHAIVGHFIIKLL